MISSLSVTCTAPTTAPLRLLVCMAITPWPPRPYWGNSSVLVRLPYPFSLTVRICLPSAGMINAIMLKPSAMRIPRTPLAVLPMGRTSLSAKRIALPLLLTSITSLLPSVIAVPTSSSPSSSSMALRPTLRWRAKLSRAVFFTVPLAVAMNTKWFSVYSLTGSILVIRSFSSSGRILMMGLPLDVLLATGIW